MCQWEEMKHYLPTKAEFLHWKHCLHPCLPGRSLLYPSHCFCIAVTCGIVYQQCVSHVCVDKINQTGTHSFKKKKNNEKTAPRATGGHKGVFRQKVKQKFTLRHLHKFECGIIYVYSCYLHESRKHTHTLGCVCRSVHPLTEVNTHQRLLPLLYPLSWRKVQFPFSQLSTLQYINTPQ